VDKGIKILLKKIDVRKKHNRAPPPFAGYLIILEKISQQGPISLYNQYPTLCNICTMCTFHPRSSKDQEILADP
jgi:hypothetical protein